VALSNETVLVTVNGVQRPIPRGTTVQLLLVNLGIDPAHVVVEINTTIVNRELFENATLAEGETVEIIRFVGGG
jgi:thiamine biosynthesis protein ThiS